MLPKVIFEICFPIFGGEVEYAVLGETVSALDKTVQQMSYKRNIPTVHLVYFMLPFSCLHYIKKIQFAITGNAITSCFTNIKHDVPNSALEQRSTTLIDSSGK